MRGTAYLIAAVLLVILTGCVRQIELVEDPTVIVQLAEPVSAMVWIPDPETGKLFKAERIIPAGKLIVDRRWKKGDDDAR